MKTKCESQRTPVGLREESPFPTTGEIKDWIRSGLIERPNSRKEKYSTRAGLVDKDQTEAYWDDKTFSCEMGSSGQRTLKILNSKVLFNFGGCRGGPHISPPALHFIEDIAETSLLQDNICSSQLQSMGTDCYNYTVC